MTTSIMNIDFTNAQGELVCLRKMNAKIFLIVNVASKCGLTPQYEGLQALYSKYRDLGLEIIGFPANEFLSQEPGTNKEIQNFCKLNYDVTFPISQKIVVKGKGQHPLYKALTEGYKHATANPKGSLLSKLNARNLHTGEPHDIKWNFEKFLVNSDGIIIERFNPDIKPSSPFITKKIEKSLC